MQKFKIIPNQYLQDYITYCHAIDRESEMSVVYLSIFDNYCYRNWPEASDITQEMVDSWCAQRITEKNNSTRSRIYPVINFLQYLQNRGLTDIKLPDIPRHAHIFHMPLRNRNFRTSFMNAIIIQSIITVLWIEILRLPSLYFSGCFIVAEYEQQKQDI